MISDAMATKLNDQINQEFYSAYLYLALSTESEALNLTGTAAWFLAKHGEEMRHAMKMVRYLQDQNAEVVLTGIGAPPPKAGSVLAMFQRTLEHERTVTASIHDLVDHALGEKDHATSIYLHWFVTEQIEEEATVNDILGRLTRFGDTGQGLLMIDQELATRAQTITQAASATL